MKYLYLNDLLWNHLTLITINMAIEKIISSAILIWDKIIIWKRHHNCIKNAVELWLIPLKPIDIKISQWFYTSKCRYVDRVKWYRIALKAYQIDKKNNEYLYSEDLR